MRLQLLALTLIATAMASGASAQQAAPPPKTFMSSKEIMGLIDKAKADRKGEAPLVAEPILSLAPYGPSSNTVPVFRRRLSMKKMQSSWLSWKAPATS